MVVLVVVVGQLCQEMVVLDLQVKDFLEELEMARLPFKQVVVVELERLEIQMGLELVEMDCQALLLDLLSLELEEEQVEQTALLEVQEMVEEEEEVFPLGKPQMMEFQIQAVVEVEDHLKIHQLVVHQVDLG
jgi:tRNA-binding EMAP/Myf-like protein